MRATFSAWLLWLPTLLSDFCPRSRPAAAWAVRGLRSRCRYQAHALLLQTTRSMASTTPPSVVCQPSRHPVSPGTADVRRHDRHGHAARRLLRDPNRLTGAPYASANAPERYDVAFCTE